jgi:hypothetical protein
MSETLEAALALAFSFVDHNDRRQLLDACPRDAAVRQQWFAQHGRVLLPSNLHAAKRLMAGHTMKPFITRIVAESVALLQAVPLDLPSLSHIELVCARDVLLQSGELDAISEPRGLPPSVTRLDLEQATLDDVVVLTHLPNLTALKLPLLKSTTAATSLGDVLAQLTKLRELSFYDVSLNDLKLLSKLTRLRSLKLRTLHVVDLMLLRDLSCLKILDIRGCQIANVDAFAGKATTLSLKTLIARQAVVVPATGTAEISAVSLDEDGGSVLLQALIDATNRPQGYQLSALNLAGMTISNIAGLPTLKHLTALSLVMPEEIDWSPLLQLPCLQYLNQHGDCVYDTEQWGIIAALPALRVLRDPTAISDDQALDHVEQLLVTCSDDEMCPDLCYWPRLTSVKWVGACHTEFIMCFPVQLRRLVLELDYCIELSYLERLTQLESLRVRCHDAGYQLEGEITTESSDYSFLHSLTSLERLELENEPFNDLEALRPLQKLRHLSVMGTMVVDVIPLLSLATLEYVDLKDTPVLLHAPVLTDLSSVLRQHPRLRRFRHPRGHDLIAPFTPDNVAPPPIVPDILSNSFDFIE